VEFTAFQNPFPLATHNLGLALNTSLKTHITQAKPSISISMRAEWIPNRIVTAGRGSRRIAVLKMESLKKNRVVLLSLVFAVGIAALGSQAVGATKTTSTSELFCIEPKSNHVIHPTSTRCPKGYSKLILNAQGLQGIPGVQSEAGAQGIQGIQGIQGLIGATGAPGINGSHILQGTTTLTNEMGVDGDYFFNSALRIIYGPKTNGLWPEGVNLSGGTGATGPAGTTGAAGATGAAGPAGATGAAGSNGVAGANGAQGTNGSNGFAPLSTCGSTGTTLCTIGATGPGGGLIFFVDYNNQYSGFNYLEAAPADLSGTMTWSDTIAISVSGANGWAARAVGRGQANTTAIVTAFPTSGAAVSADAYSSPSYNSVVKSDWFLGSIGEMKLMYDNLQGLGGLVATHYWSSSEIDSRNVWFQYFTTGYQNTWAKADPSNVRPVRSF